MGLSNSQAAERQQEGGRKKGMKREGEEGALSSSEGAGRERKRVK